MAADDYLRAQGKPPGDPAYCCPRCAAGKTPKAGDLAHRWPRPALTSPTYSDLSPTLTPAQRRQLQLDVDAGKKGSRTVAARKTLAEITSAPDFDTSRAATIARLEKSLANTSVTILQLSENGNVSESMHPYDQLTRVAQALRALTSTIEIDPAQLTDEQIAAAAK